MNTSKAVCLAGLIALSLGVSTGVSADIVIGAEQDRMADVALFGNDGFEIDRFAPFNESFSGGVRVATGDVNGDGTPDIITGAGPGGGPHVRVFDGQTNETLLDLTPFQDYPGFSGGVFVAAGDIDGDGVAELVTAAGAGGGPHVRVFDGLSGTQLSEFAPYGTGFSGGVRVATGDINGDGNAEIITSPGIGAGGRVLASDALGLPLIEFSPYGTGFQGGVFVAAGDIDGDGIAEVIVSPDQGAKPQVRVFDLRSSKMILSFYAYSPRFTGGVRVAAGDITGDGVADIITAPGPGGGPHVKVFNGRSGRQAMEFFAGDRDSFDGVFVAGL